MLGPLDKALQGEVKLMFIPAKSVLFSQYTFGYALEHGEWISDAALELLEMFISKWLYINKK